VIDEEVNGDCACADEASGKRANRAAEDCAGYDSDGDAAAVFDAVALDAGVGLNGSFADYAGFGADGAANVGMEPVVGAVRQNDNFRLETHCASTADAAAGHLYDATVNLRAGGDEDLSALEDVHCDGAAEAVALFGIGCGKAVEQVDPDLASGLQFAGLERTGMDNVAVGVGRIAGLIVGALIQDRRRRRLSWHDPHDTVVGAVAILRGGEIGGWIDRGGLWLVLGRSGRGCGLRVLLNGGWRRWRRDGLAGSWLGGGDGGGDDDVIGRRVRLAGIGVVLISGLACVLRMESGSGNGQQARQQTHDDK